MAKAANTKLIGLFVLAGIALIVAAIVIFGGGRLFKPAKSGVMYFTASVQGLNVGSPVMFRGVPVGRVNDIDLLYDPSTLSFLTRVGVNLFPENWRTIASDYVSEAQRYRDLVEAGLRAQLVPVSLVTGQLGIGLDMFPGTPVVQYAGTPVAPADRGVSEIPTIPSTIERLETTMQRILTVIDKADFDQLSKDVDQTIEAIRNLITMPELHNMIVNADATVSKASTTMKSLEHLIASLDRDVGPAMKNLRQVMETANAAMTDARTLVPELKRDLAQVGPLVDKVNGTLTAAQALLKNLNTTVEPGSPLQYEIANALRELTLTMRSVRGLADSLEQSPNSVLFGRVPGGRQ